MLLIASLRIAAAVAALRSPVLTPGAAYWSDATGYR